MTLPHVLRHSLPGRQQGPSPPPSAHNRRRAHLLIALSVLALSGLACNLAAYLSEDEPGAGDPSAFDPDEAMSLAEALDTSLEDRRGRVLESLGAPDTFTITFQELDGTVVRSEHWSYHDYGSRIDFVDGEILWTVELEPVPDGSIYAHWYDPLAFRGFMSEAEVGALLSYQQLTRIDLAEGDIPGGRVLVGDQILLGFDNDRLVYVETLMLSPEVAP